MMWYWLREDHSVEPGPKIEDRVAYNAYGNWLYGKTNGISNRRIAFTETVTGLEVSTVFLGLDHSHGGRRPVLFETMVFRHQDGGRDTVAQGRYFTWDEAMEGHKANVADHGGPVIIEPVTAQGAREYEEIMALQEINSPDK